VILVPRMAMEPPPGYVSFVARHLEPLRKDAADVVGDERDADLLYPDVLTDVAGRWAWLELLRTRLGRPTAADVYLGQAFARRSQQWHAEQLSTVDLTVWRNEDDWAQESRPVVVWSDAAWEAERSGAAWLDPPPVAVAPKQVRTNLAVKLAPFVRPARVAAGPVAEAAIAWWHAYEAYRRRRVIAVFVVIFLIIAVLSHLAATVRS
jgi:hypothetical protein